MTIVESLCFGGFALCWGLQQAPHTLAGPSVCWYMLGGWIIVIFFFKRVQKKERHFFSNFYVQSTIYIFDDPIMCCACNLTDEEIEVQRS